MSFNDEEMEIAIYGLKRLGMFAASLIVAFLIGMVIPFFMTISQINSPNNAADYFKTYGKYIDLEQVVNGDDK